MGHFALLDPDPDPATQINADPQPWVWIRIRLQILLSSSKTNKKNLDSYCFVTSLDFLSLKNDVNVPSKSNKHKKFSFKIGFCWGLESQ
jgi:hypothetical protein